MAKSSWYGFCGWALHQRYIAGGTLMATKKGKTTKRTAKKATKRGRMLPKKTTPKLAANHCETILGSGD